MTLRGVPKGSQSHRNEGADLWGVAALRICPHRGHELAGIAVSAGHLADGETLRCALATVLCESTNLRFLKLAVMSDSDDSDLDEMLLGVTGGGAKRKGAQKPKKKAAKKRRVAESDEVHPPLYTTPLSLLCQSLALCRP
jgi:hypothetical protein